jgi:hypothetical protein
VETSKGCFLLLSVDRNCSISVNIKYVKLLSAVAEYVLWDLDNRVSLVHFAGVIITRGVK